MGAAGGRGLQHQAGRAAPAATRPASAAARPRPGGLHHAVALRAPAPSGLVHRYSWGAFWDDVKSGAKAFGGAVYGAGKTVVSGVVGVGQATYYSTSYLLYNATGSDIWKEQAETYERGMDSLLSGLDTIRRQGLVETVKRYVKVKGDRFMAAIDANDPWAAGEVWGEVGMETYMLARTAAELTPGRPPGVPAPVPQPAFALAGGGAPALATVGPRLGATAVAAAGPEVEALALSLSMAATTLAKSSKKAAATQGSGGSPAKAGGGKGTPRPAAEPERPPVAVPPTGRQEIVDDALRRAGVKKQSQLPFKSKWNLQEKLAVDRLIERLGLMVDEQVVLFEQKTGSKVLTEIRTPDVLVYEPSTGKSVLVELTAQKNVAVGAKGAQVADIRAALARAAQGQSTVWARPQGSPALVDISRARFEVTRYSHWGEAYVDVIRRHFE